MQKIRTLTQLLRLTVHQGYCLLLYYLFNSKLNVRETNDQGEFLWFGKLHYLIVLDFITLSDNVVVVVAKREIKNK